MKLWTDGSCLPNPGPGGYAVIDESGQLVKSGWAGESTNNRMEGWALVAAMEYAGDEPCEIFTDSQFWINVVTNWAPKWEENGWRRKPLQYDKEGRPFGGGKPIENLDVVVKLYRTYQRKNVTLTWVKGHAGRRNNELADQRANEMREKGIREGGVGHEKSDCENEVKK